MISENLQYAMFSRKEMESRYARARELMERRGIDALLISGEENFQYFAGTAASLALHYSLTRPSIFILPADREPIIVTQGKDNLVLGSYVTDIRLYDEILSFPLTVVLDAIGDAGLKLRRLGVELGLEQRMGMPVGAYLDLVSRMSDTEFVDAADIIVGLRMVKSVEELAYINRAAEVTGLARQRLFGQVVPGMTEREVARRMRQLVLEEGGDRTSFVILQLDVAGSKNQFHYDRPLQAGTILAVDAGAYVGMYTIDYVRMASLGPATEMQKRVHSAVLNVNEKMADALKPGVTCSEIYRLGARAIEDLRDKVADLERLSSARMGHGQGMLLTEPPSVNPEDHTRLEPGMVISTEPGVRSGNVQFQWEDVHVITEEGHEQLTLETDELRELAF